MQLELLKQVLTRNDESHAAADRDAANTAVAAAHFHLRNFLHTADLMATQKQDVRVCVPVILLPFLFLFSCECALVGCCV